MVNLLIAKYTSKRPCIGKCGVYRGLKPTIRSTPNLLLFIRCPQYTAVLYSGRMAERSKALASRTSIV